MKKIVYLWLLLAASTFATAQKKIQSPAEFLGYELGTKFTFHHRVIDYYEYVAQQAPNRVKLVSYGTSFEGRPLLVAFVANETNLAQLEDIRTNNLKSIGLLEGKPTAKVPAIAWMSYNIHGNEAISSEAAMQVLYELLNTANELTQGVLKNTVVALDPCLNPDGFDRYVQWYNRYVSATPDFTLASVEHNEPWPGGRFNHYLFDLNRDWAWQTQKETQQRMRLYNAWMPHLHGDFHEMGPNSTYYFAPSAKPYHENLTGWQRKFQEILGDYNKKHFDKKGWLYFTKESFDLLYPSYGDTYPSYNGAIGMTFEQGGSGRAGINFIREDGDTITLAQRIEHHFTATMGTLEAISANADKTVAEFVTYFQEPANKGIGKYKSFVIKTAGQESKVSALTGLLDKLQIKYSFADKASSSTGYNYQSLKDESFKIDANDLIINTFQPKGTFAKILFEPATVLEDSNTYDITAWALPYAYGLNAFGVTQKLEGTTAKPAQTSYVKATSKETPYAYIIPWNTFEAAQFLAEMHKHKIKARMHTMPFEVDGKKYDHGTLLVTRQGNGHIANFEQIIEKAAESRNLALHRVYSGMVAAGFDLGSNNVMALKEPKVGLLIGEGTSQTAVGSVWHYFDQQINFPVTIIDAGYFNRTDLSKFTTLILPEGRYNSLLREAKYLQDWVNQGGKLIVMESVNRYFADKEGFGLTTKKNANTDENPLRTFGNRERESISSQIPGAIYKVTVDHTHPLGYGYKNGYYTLVKDVFGFDYLKNGWNVGTLGESSHVTGFVGNKVKNTVKNSLLFGVESKGRGSIVYMMDDPIFRGFWHNGKLLFANSVFVVE
mgnify:FL=1